MHCRHLHRLHVLGSLAKASHTVKTTPRNSRCRVRSERAAIVRTQLFAYRRVHLRRRLVFRVAPSPLDSHSARWQAWRTIAELQLSSFSWSRLRRLDRNLTQQRNETLETTLRVLYLFATMAQCVLHCRVQEVLSNASAPLLRARGPAKSPSKSRPSAGPG